MKHLRHCQYSTVSLESKFWGNYLIGQRNAASRQINHPRLFVRKKDLGFLGEKKQSYKNRLFSIFYDCQSYLITRIKLKSPLKKATP